MIRRCDYINIGCNCGIGDCRQCRSGFVFALLLWIIIAMTALALSLGLSVRSQMYRTANITARAKADLAQCGALQYVLQTLSDSEGLPVAEEDFQADGVMVGDCVVWILAGDSDGDGQMNFGLIDEGGRLDLNTAPADILAELDGVGDAVAAAIIDWRDSDDEISSAGAESDYYQRQRENPHSAKNDDFESTLELSLVAGVDDEMLFGEDTNMNLLLDDNENDGRTTAPDDDRNSSLRGGLASWCSGFLSWPNSDSDLELVDINTATTSELRDLLAKYLSADRAVELATNASAGSGGGSGGNSNRNLHNVLEMYQSWNMTREELELIEPYVTFSFTEPTMRLNINAASGDVLLALGMLDEADVAAILTARSSRDDASDTSIAWVLDSALSAEKLSQLAAIALAGRSYQYRADVLVASVDGRAYSRWHYIVDVSQSAPRVIYARDISSLGWPLDGEILTRLRSGDEVDDVLDDYR